MTDDEVRQLLRPKHNWLAIGAFILTLLGFAAALGRWVFTAPTREDYENLSNRAKAVELDHAILKVGVEGIRSDLTDVKTSTKEINAQLMQLRLNRR